jgi:formylglycine-generating enzyme
MSAIRAEHFVLVLALSVGLACKSSARPTPAAGEAADAAPPWAPKTTRAPPTPPLGMVWVPEGTLVAGTPVEQLPRVADEEMPGEQLVLGGFFIDVFAHPNEEGAIPETGATHSQAEKICAEQGKRLCTELEWERACKGPENTTYEYGDRYRPEACLTGRSSRMLPSGYRPACRTEFGVRDMHGGVWEWTSSRFGRGREGALFTLRGGNGAAGEVIGRCANSMARAPDTVSSQIGFRCCKGPKNEAEVDFRIDTGPPLVERGESERGVARSLISTLPDDVRRTLAGYGVFRISNVWDWRPIGNVAWVVGGGCAGASPSRRCGVVVGRPDGEKTTLLAWVWVGMFPPAVRVSRDPRRLWVYGGDRMSHFRQPVLFEWGKLRVGEVERNVRPGAD